MSLIEFRSRYWRTRRGSNNIIRDGQLYLSLKDAIDLALENNLDLAIARYNLPIANTDILRTQAGGFFRGVNTGVVQGTPGGGVGGFGTGAPARARAVRQVAPAAPEQALQAWCSLRLALEPPCRPTTHSSISMVARSIKRPLSQTSRFMECHPCSSIPDK